MSIKHYDSHEICSTRALFALFVSLSFSPNDQIKIWIFCLFFLFHLKEQFNMISNLVLLDIDGNHWLLSDHNMLCPLLFTTFLSRVSFLFISDILNSFVDNIFVINLVDIYLFLVFFFLLEWNQILYTIWTCRWYHADIRACL